MLGVISVKGEVVHACPSDLAPGHHGLHVRGACPIRQLPGNHVYGAQSAQEGAVQWEDGTADR